MLLSYIRTALLGRYDPKTESARIRPTHPDHQGQVDAHRQAALVALAHVERLEGDYASAGGNYREALRISETLSSTEIIAGALGSLAQLALDQANWQEAETMARKALVASEKIGHQLFIAADCLCLVQSLVQQGKKAEGLPYIQRCVDTFARLQQADQLQIAQTLLIECRS